MGWFFDCFRVQNEGKEGKNHSSILSKGKGTEGFSSKNQISSGKEDKGPFEQAAILKSTSAHGRNRETRDQRYLCKTASKNQLSAVFLREDLEEEASIERTEYAKPAECIGTGIDKRVHKEDEGKDDPNTKQETPKSSKSSPNSSTDSKPTNSFIDKHILKEESPTSIIKTPIPKISQISNNESEPDSCNSAAESDVVTVSLSHWLKPPKPFDIFSVKSQSGVSTDSDRPIIGSVATHWSEELENVNFVPPPPKVWDGKGIPNSTNKYKEDQKVSWHATPFEERLEKALSEEKHSSQRVCSSNIPLEFTDEGEESDTAAS